MPLNAHKPLIVGVLNGLHKQVIVDRDHPKIVPQPLYCLAVNTVSANGRGLHNLAKPAVLNDMDRLKREQERAVSGVVSERRHVLAKSAPVKHINELGAPADPQYRQADLLSML